MTGWIGCKASISSIAGLALAMALTGCSTEGGSHKTGKKNTQLVPVPPEPRIEINISKQLLTFYGPDGRYRVYPVSTAKNGAGQRAGSGKTPLGKHVVIEKVGDGLPWNAVFKYGAFTGKYYDEKKYKGTADPILSRIIRIAGTESGFNTGLGVSTEHRRIYIHGTPPSERPQDRTPKSRGCIRMNVNHIIDLYQRVPVGTSVIIREK